MTNHPWLVPESRRPADRLIINDNYLLASMMCPTHLDVDNGCAYHVDNCRAFARRMRKIALRSLLLKFTAKDQPPNQPFAILSQFRRQESPSIAGLLMPGSLLRVVHLHGAAPARRPGQLNRYPGADYSHAEAPMAKISGQEFIRGKPPRHGDPWLNSQLH